MHSLLVSKIIDLEWLMFTSVNEGKARASCQDDKAMFAVMRAAQFEAWPPDIQDSYLCDLREANRTGRNLLAEKYIHMMRSTAPKDYEELVEAVERPSERGCELAREINDALLSQTHKLNERYPKLSKQGRPLYSSEDRFGVTSIETYQLGELLTYSLKTLVALSNYVDSENGKLLAERILENTIRYYGYQSLEHAEKAIRGV